MELLVTLFTDLPLDERRFHGLLHDLASNGDVGTIAPDGLYAVHSFGEGQNPHPGESMQVTVQSKDSIAAPVVRQLRQAGFRPAHALEFRAPAGSQAQQHIWPLLHAYVGELQGWVLTTRLNFEETASAINPPVDLFAIAAAGNGQSNAVLISATTMKQLAP